MHDSENKFLKCKFCALYVTNMMIEAANPSMRDHLYDVVKAVLFYKQ